MSILILASFVLGYDALSISYRSRSLSDEQLAPDASPSVFVAVSSFRSNFNRRVAIRRGWSSDLQERVTLRFAICAGDDLVHRGLDLEIARHGDLMLLGCEEGDKPTQQTRKLLLAMREYSTNHARMQFFMKIEDDTFVPWKRLLSFLEKQTDPALAFMGVPVPAGRQVNRDSASRWYQPCEVYPNETYPTYMSRIGYLIGADVVQHIVEGGVADRLILSNEDQAVGVWVDKVASSGLGVSYIALPYGAGYNFNWGETGEMGKWEQYPYLLHHGLHPEILSCLAWHDAEERDDSAVATCLPRALFVAAFSARGNLDRRLSMRHHWGNADKASGRINGKFALCDATDDLSPKIRDEAVRYGDILLLDCDEGTGAMQLTRKLFLAMRAAADDSHMVSFMKIEDDTFVPWRRFLSFAASQTDLARSFMGIPVPAGMLVNRDRGSQWYQCEDMYPNSTYPIYMDRTGYLIGGDVVRNIIANGIAEKMILSTEDQAAGVWVDKVASQGIPISYMTLPNRQGTDITDQAFCGSWAEYPYLLHHALPLAHIYCLARMDAEAQLNESMVPCFSGSAPCSYGSIFVAVFSARGNGHRRVDMRRQLAHAGIMGTRIEVNAKFALCAADDALGGEVAGEAAKYGDILLLACEEGIGRQLTTKLLLAMRTAAIGPGRLLAFVKVEDDTFIPWRRFVDFAYEHPALKYSFMGTQMSAGKPVNRDPDSPYYQPEDTYPNKTYPVYMERIGYLIGGDLLRKILDWGIADGMLLTNEDQAAGVWVDRAAARGAPVSYIALPSRHGYDAGDKELQGTWAEYTYMMHHAVKPKFAACLASVDKQGSIDQSVAPCFKDSLFVAVFSARGNRARRTASRELLQGALSAEDISSGFVLCDAEDEYVQDVQAENDTFHDLIILDCVEGYNQTLLTTKAIKTMQHYLAKETERDYLFKVDDDTFVAWARLRELLAVQASSAYAYMGLRSPPGMLVNRNPTSTWYQPVDAYPNETYPMFMEGGSGYIMGRQLVQRIIDEGIAQSHVLSNEDQAVGVWVNQLLLRGAPVTYIDIMGTDGYRPENDVCFGTWKEYPYLLHHRLTAEAISCLAKVEAAHDERLSIDHCFEACAGYTATFLRSYTNSLDAEASEAVEKLKKVREKVALITRARDYLSSQANSHSFSAQADDLARAEGFLSRMEEAASTVREVKGQLREMYARSGVMEGAEGPGPGPVPVPAALLATPRVEVEAVADGAGADGAGEAALVYLRIPGGDIFDDALEEANAGQNVSWPRKWLSFWKGMYMPDENVCSKYHVPPGFLQLAEDPDADVFGRDTFCFVRDPRERAVGAYRRALLAERSPAATSGLLDFPRCTKEGLNRFIQSALSSLRAGKKYVHDCHFVPQTEFVWGTDGRKWCKQVLHAEGLSSGLLELHSDSGGAVSLQLASGGRRQTCPGLTSADLSQETAASIDDMYREDIQKLGFLRPGHA